MDDFMEFLTPFLIIIALLGLLLFISSHLRDMNREADCIYRGGVMVQVGERKLFPYTRIYECTVKE